MRLTAPNISATTGITIGERAISVQGTWSSSSLELLHLQGTEVDVEIPAGSAASLDFLI